MKLKYLFFFLSAFATCNVVAQEVIIKGNVSKKNNKEKLAGATVKVGSEITKTNENGLFILNVQKKELIEKGIDISSVGYYSIHFIYEPDHFFEIELIENIVQLKEVMIGNGHDIIKKAIKKIPSNYPDKPITIKGILRTQTWRNRSEYFKSDAIIKVYIPSYSSNTKASVSVLQNKIDTLYDKSLESLRQTSNYHVVDFQDIAHNNYILEKISKKMKFNYWLVGKQIYNGHKVFVINTNLKDTTKIFDKIDATLYIDTATYAFVAANIYTYNLSRKGLLKLNMLNYRVMYEKIGKKWYLMETHTIVDSELKNQSPQSTIDFIRTEIDSINVEKIAYKDIVQRSDNILLIDKPVDDKMWLGNDSLFKKAENEGKMTIISDSLLYTIKKNNLVGNLFHQKNKKSFRLILLDYLSKDNVRNTLMLKDMPLLIKSDLLNVSDITNFGISYGIKYRIYKNIYLGLEGSRNLWNCKKINLYTIAINISNDFVFNKISRNITLTPHIGYENISVDYDKSKININNLYYSFRFSYELTHKLAIFFASDFNSTMEKYTLNGLNISPTKYPIGLGLIFKR